jgi:hypothetical protein
VCAVEELAHLGDLHVVEATGLAEVVDEEAVALVGGDATRRGVGLGEEPFLLEHGHLVAHGGRRNVDVVGAGDVGGADGLARTDVLLHHGSQDGGLAIIKHGDQ